MNNIELYRLDDSNTIRFTEVHYDLYHTLCVKLTVLPYYELSNGTDTDMILSLDTLIEMHNSLLNMLPIIDKNDITNGDVEMFKTMLHEEDGVECYNNIEYNNYPVTLEILIDGDETIIDLTIDEVKFLIVHLPIMINKVKLNAKRR